jgi:hypothetical protein
MIERARDEGKAQNTTDKTREDIFPCFLFACERVPAPGNPKPLRPHLPPPPTGSQTRERKFKKIEKGMMSLTKHQQKHMESSFFKKKTLTSK